MQLVWISFAILCVFVWVLFCFQGGREIVFSFGMFYVLFFFVFLSKAKIILVSFKCIWFWFSKDGGDSNWIISVLFFLFSVVNVVKKVQRAASFQFSSSYKQRWVWWGEILLNLNIKWHKITLHVSFRKQRKRIQSLAS